MSVRRARRELGPREFLRWQLKILLDESDAEEREWKRAKRADYHAAMVCQQIDLLRNTVSAFGQGIGALTKSEIKATQLKDFLLKFDFGDQITAKEIAAVKPAEELTEEERERRRESAARIARLVWGSRLKQDIPE